MSQYRVLPEDQQIEIYARMTTFQFLIEILLANHFRDLPPRQREEGIAAIREKMADFSEMPRAASEEDAVFYSDIAMRCQSYTAHILEKAQERLGV